MLDAYDLYMRGYRSGAHATCEGLNAAYHPMVNRAQVVMKDNRLARLLCLGRPQRLQGPNPTLGRKGKMVVPTSHNENGVVSRLNHGQCAVCGIGIADGF